MPLEADAQTRFRAKIFNALSDPIRLQIIEFLREREKCVCEITPHLGLVQPLVSRHLRILKKAGLVKRRKEGTWHYYSLTDNSILEIIDRLTPQLLELIKRKIIEQIA